MSLSKQQHIGQHQHLSFFVEALFSVECWMCSTREHNFLNNPTMNVQERGVHMNYARGLYTTDTAQWQIADNSVSLIGVDRVLLFSFNIGLCQNRSPAVIQDIREDGWEPRYIYHKSETETRLCNKELTEKVVDRTGTPSVISALSSQSLLAVTSGALRYIVSLFFIMKVFKEFEPFCF